MKNKILEKKKNELAELKKQMAALSKLVSSKIAEIEALERQNDDIITDHALLRYLERATGIKCEELRKFLETEELKCAIAIGAKKYKKDNLVFVIKNAKVITIFDE